MQSFGSLLIWYTYNYIHILYIYTHQFPTSNTSWSPFREPSVAVPVAGRRSPVVPEIPTASCSTLPSSSQLQQCLLDVYPAWQNVNEKLWKITMLSMGKSLVNYGKSPCYEWVKIHYEWTIFNSYLKLPEGTFHGSVQCCVSESSCWLFRWICHDGLPPILTALEFSKCHQSQKDRLPEALVNQT